MQFRTHSDFPIASEACPEDACLKIWRRIAKRLRVAGYPCSGLARRPFTQRHCGQRD
ncbi:hypothetical protein EMGBS3_08940 [Anaerolineaceae bacterium]|nr:hypothetical protein EMGBS3_08940 [Anaerolineaceae bacterium]GBL37751.1 hypothetical protein EMGBD1_14380 [Anaerolineaceae bacterium]